MNVMRPETEQELAEMVRGAAGPLSLRGGGTRGPLAAGDVVDLTGLSGISLYEPGALTIVAAAGTSLAGGRGGSGARRSVSAV